MTSNCGTKLWSWSTGTIHFLHVYLLINLSKHEVFMHIQVLYTHCIANVRPNELNIHSDRPTVLVTACPVLTAVTPLIWEVFFNSDVWLTSLCSCSTARLQDPKFPSSICHHNILRSSWKCWTCWICLGLCGKTFIRSKCSLCSLHIAL